MGGEALGWPSGGSRAKEYVEDIRCLHLQYNSNSKPGIGLDRGVIHSYLSFKDHLCLLVEKAAVGAKRRKEENS